MLRIVVKREVSAHPGNRTPVSTVGGYYDTTTPDALIVVNGATTKNLGERQTQHMKWEVFLYQVIDFQILNRP